jgi:Ser-tRNA(Ala) deacylase AlaX
VLSSLQPCSSTNQGDVSGLKVGDSVSVHVDWERRWDHAVQHSAQHLISALALREFGAETLSWSFGAEACVVELCTPIDAGRLEATANSAIRDGLEVKAEWHSVADVNSGAVAGLRMSSRALPESVTGPVRVVRFAGVDTNTCCGTHVR